MVFLPISWPFLGQNGAKKWEHLLDNSNKDWVWNSQQNQITKSKQERKLKTDLNDQNVCRMSTTYYIGVQTLRIQWHISAREGLEKGGRKNWSIMPSLMTWQDPMLFWLGQTTKQTPNLKHIKEIVKLKHINKTKN